MTSLPNTKLGQVILSSNLVLSTIIRPQNTIFVHIYPYLHRLTAMYLYLAKCNINYPYLVEFVLNGPDICPR